jgi:hypothetical protein
MSAIGIWRRFAAVRKFGRFSIEADIAAGFMSARPSNMRAAVTGTTRHQSRSVSPDDPWLTPRTIAVALSAMGAIIHGEDRRLASLITPMRMRGLQARDAAL